MNITAKFSHGSSKIPAITLMFWVIKIAATTFGETGGDALSMTLNLGYAVSTLIFNIFLLATLYGQLNVKTYHPFLYWAVIVSTTTVGTTLADFMTRSIGIGYVGGSALLVTMLIGILIAWKSTCGSISINKIASRRSEIYYWFTILLSNTLGTALGDYFADQPAIGYTGGALVFSGLLAIVLLLHFTTRISKTILFWLAFILTRPLGATVGDILTKPIAHGGLDLGRFLSSGIILAFIVICILSMPRKPQAAV